NRHNNLHGSLSNRLNASVRTQTKGWNSAFWNAAFQTLECARKPERKGSAREFAATNPVNPSLIAPSAISN
ncbi:hypothetical protein, partial [Paraburkholderia sediminicola]|uniref:hypothetical protein n=1 Tax=Paraburkholderia sediminicola TaxID=458836 RepID=UPI0038BA0F22